MPHACPDVLRSPSAGKTRILPVCPSVSLIDRPDIHCPRPHCPILTSDWSPPLSPSFHHSVSWGHRAMSSDPSLDSGSSLKRNLLSLSSSLPLFEFVSFSVPQLYFSFSPPSSSSSSVFSRLFTWIESFPWFCFHHHLAPEFGLISSSLHLFFSSLSLPAPHAALTWVWRPQRRIWMNRNSLTLLPIQILWICKVRYMNMFLRVLQRRFHFSPGDPQTCL